MKYAYKFFDTADSLFEASRRLPSGKGKWVPIADLAVLIIGSYVGPLSGDSMCSVSDPFNGKFRVCHRTGRNDDEQLAKEPARTAGPTGTSIVLTIMTTTACWWA